MLVCKHQKKAKLSIQKCQVPNLWTMCVPKNVRLLKIRSYSGVSHPFHAWNSGERKTHTKTLESHRHRCFSHFDLHHKNTCQKQQICYINHTFLSPCDPPHDLDKFECRTSVADPKSSWDQLVGWVSFTKRGDRFERFSRRVRSISRELRKGRSCCTFFLVHAYLQLSATLSTRTSHRTCFRATSWGNGKFWSNQQNHNFALLDPWFCLTPATPIQPKSDGFPCKLVSVEPEAKNSP